MGCVPLALWLWSGDVLTAFRLLFIDVAGLGQVWFGWRELRFDVRFDVGHHVHVDVHFDVRFDVRCDVRQK